jgi:DNA-binding MarR family transcriptional regulator
VKIEEAIQQATFETLGSKTGINILYTASWMHQLLARALKPCGISWQQFNILRILNGQKGNPAPLFLVSERMIDRMSNTSRLVDKLVAKGLVERRQCPRDRRQVELLLTQKGSEILEVARQRTFDLIEPVFLRMPQEGLNALNDTLDAIRG